VVSLSFVFIANSTCTLFLTTAVRPTTENTWWKSWKLSAWYTRG